MGQQSSTNLQEFIQQSFCKIVHDDKPNATQTNRINEMMIAMSYDEFLIKLGELNKLSNKCLDTSHSDKKLLFAVKKGSDASFLWKATIQVACVRIDPKKDRVETYRLLNLREFLQVFDTLENQCLNVGSSKTDSEQPQECCICFERKSNISLPCAHCYCVQCIEEWNEDHHNCPICREQLKSTNDTWVLSEVPHSDEISAELQSMLMNLAATSNDERTSASCRQF